VLDGLKSAAGDSDLATLDATIGGLGKRQFMLVSATSDAPVVFATRCAMSYLRGPLTRDQGALLMHDVAAAPVPEAAPAPAPARDATPVAPPVAAGIPVAYLDLAAPWATQLNAAAGGGQLHAYLAARLSVRFDDTKAAVDEREEYEALYGPLDDGLDLERETLVEFDDRDFGAAAPDPAHRRPPPMPRRRRSATGWRPAGTSSRPRSAWPSVASKSSRSTSACARPRSWPQARVRFSARSSAAAGARDRSPVRSRARRRAGGHPAVRRRGAAPLRRR
jgi:hypothetical protein